MPNVLVDRGEAFPVKQNRITINMKAYQPLSLI
jgi:hypothetical protein